MLAAGLNGPDLAAGERVADLLRGSAPLDRHATAVSGIMIRPLTCPAAVGRLRHRPVLQTWG
jgi:hypothetical protein